ncbi:MAG: hypothetical protein NTY81_00745 [Candidatus Staskawiczbacteria bacterium]|nr:hypothetical protein [Candidatus Staskawiczbacteria bacterium]
MENKLNQQKSWVIAADMGYGHQRTAYPLRDIAFSNRVIRANNYVGIPEKDMATKEQLIHCGILLFLIGLYEPIIMLAYPKKTKSFGSKHVPYMSLFQGLKGFLFWGILFFRLWTGFRKF